MTVDLNQFEIRGPYPALTAIGYGNLCPCTHTFKYRHLGSFMQIKQNGIAYRRRRTSHFRFIASLVKYNHRLIMIHIIILLPYGKRKCSYKQY